MINAAMVEMDISNQNNTLETTVAVTVPLHLGNETEDICNTSTISEGVNEKTVESITAKINPSDKANFREPLAHEDRQMGISLGPYQPISPFQRHPTQKGRCFSELFYTKVSQAGVKLKRTTLSYWPAVATAFIVMPVDCSRKTVIRLG